MTLSTVINPFLRRRPTPAHSRTTLLQRLLLLGTVLCGSLASSASADVAIEKYLRFVEAPEHSQLQTSIIRFENKDGVRVDLIGAVHIADGSYYTQLNERFKQYDALLYEMVKPKDRDMGQPVGEQSGGAVSGVQRFMKNQLELNFQLDDIDYSPANFVHADLDVESFFAKQEEQGESMLSLMFESMMQEMSRAQPRPGSEMGIMDLVNALQAPDRGRQMKLFLGKQMGSMDDVLGGLGGKDGSVILDERNKHALQVLAKEIEGGKKHLAVFYGAGHMPGMEETMTSLMGFKQVGEAEWVVAWDIDSRPAAPAKPLAPATQPVKQPAAATGATR